MTMPTTAPVDHINHDMHRFMPLGAKRMFAQLFDESDIVVTNYGNLLTGLAYWTGLAQEDLPRRAWTRDDQVYPVIVAVHARAPRDDNDGSAR